MFLLVPLCLVFSPLPLHQFFLFHLFVLWFFFILLSFLFFLFWLDYTKSFYLFFYKSGSRTHTVQLLCSYILLMCFFIFSMQKKCHYNQFPLQDSLDDPKNEYNPKKHQKIKMVPELQTTSRIGVTLIMRTTSKQNMFQN